MNDLYLTNDFTELLSSFGEKTNEKMENQFNNCKKVKSVVTRTLNEQNENKAERAHLYIAIHE